MPNPEHTPQEGRPEVIGGSSQGASASFPPLPGPLLPESLRELRYLSFRSGAEVHCLDMPLVTLVDSLLKDREMMQSLGDYLVILGHLLPHLPTQRGVVRGNPPNLESAISPDSQETLTLWLEYRSKCFARHPVKMHVLERFLGFDTLGIHARDASAFLGKNTGRIEGAIEYLKLSSRLPEGMPHSDLVLARRRVVHELNLPNWDFVLHMNPSFAIAEGRADVSRQSGGALTVTLHPRTLSALASAPTTEVRETLDAIHRGIQLQRKPETLRSRLIGPLGYFALVAGTWFSMLRERLKKSH